LDAYTTFFRIANEGVINYQDGVVVDGKENIDDYSDTELSNYKRVVLFGYNYRNRDKAYRLLDTYVKNGGNLIVFTGWQYVDKDWQADKLPESFPVKNLVWTSQLFQTGYSLNDDNLNSEVDVSRFSPLEWANSPWGVSLPGKDSLRDNAKIILTINNSPLVAEQSYGQGRVIWTGLNWFGHISAFHNNTEEIKFLSLLFNGLSSSPEGIDDAQQVVMDRNYPDNVTFHLNKDNNVSSVFYFRESYHPDWHAILISGNNKTAVPNYRAGPALMILDLPPVHAGDSIVMEFSPGFRGLLGVAVSILVIIALLVYLIFGERFTALLFSKTYVATRLMHKKIIKKSVGWVSKTSDEQEY
jgi:hypothetical protein